MKCEKCSTENPQGARYCNTCGADLKAQQRKREKQQQRNEKKQQLSEKQPKKPVFSDPKTKVLFGGLMIIVLVAGIAIGLLLGAKSDPTPAGIPEEVLVAEVKEEQDTGYRVLDQNLPDFEEVPMYLSGGIYLFQENERYGTIDAQGEVILPAEYGYVTVSHQPDSLYDDKSKTSACLAQTPMDAKGIMAISHKECNPADFSEFNAAILLYETVGGAPVAYPYTEDQDVLDEYLDQFTGEVFVVYNSQDRKKSVENREFYLFDDRGEGLYYGPFDNSWQGVWKLYQNGARITHAYGLNPIIEGLVVLKQEQDYYVIDTQSASQIEGAFEQAIPVADAYVQVKKDGVTGLITEDLNLYWIPEAEEISAVYDDHAFAKIDGKWVLIEFTQEPAAASTSPAAGTEARRENDPASYDPENEERNLLETFVRDQGYLDVIDLEPTMKLSDLRYALSPAASDAQPFLLIEVPQGASFHETYTFTVDDGMIIYAGSTYNFGSYEYVKDSGSIVMLPEVRQNATNLTYSFYTLDGQQYELQGILMKNGSDYYFLSDEDFNSKEPISKEQFEQAESMIIPFDWKSL